MEVEIQTEGDTDCPICLEPLNGTKSEIETSCHHRFHSNCLLKSIFTSQGNHLLCPKCRTDISDIVEDTQTMPTNYHPTPSAPVIDYHPITISSSDFLHQTGEEVVVAGEHFSSADAYYQVHPNGLLLPTNFISRNSISSIILEPVSNGTFNPLSTSFTNLHIKSDVEIRIRDYFAHRQAIKV
ncbi:Ring finger domain protein [uncultured archaeon]|nr:Ring finger domain protein [uncultured archaeon]